MQASSLRKRMNVSSLAFFENHNQLFRVVWMNTNIVSSYSFSSVSFGCSIIGADSSKDSSLQSDTSIESEDSFASVIYIPKPDPQQQQPLQTNGITEGYGQGAARMPSGPTSPLVMPCPTPAHSPAPPRTKLNSVNGQNGKAGHELSQFTFDDTSSLLHKPEDVSPSASSVNSTSSTNKIKILQSPPSNALACTSSAVAAAVTTKTTVPSVPASTSKTSTLKAPVQKITRQQIKDLPPIPKFRRSGNYPILRRQASMSTATPAVPKLLSLELFNPETDDLDSDSSEPSSPDSIDSVISALRPSVSPQPVTAQPQTSGTPAAIPPLIEAAAVVAHKLEDAVELVIRESETKPKTQLNGRSDSRESSIDGSGVDDTSCRQHLVDFAEKLSAQLLKELDSEKQRTESSFEDDDDVFSESRSKAKPHRSLSNSLPITDPYLKKLNGDIRDLNQLRAELRERRLMLANLSHLGSSGLGGSNDSLGPISYGSSMTPIIQEETDDDEELNESCEMEHEDFDGFYGLRGNKKGLSKNDEFVIIPELDEDDAEMASDTALLIQEEDSSEEHLQNNVVDLLGSNNSNNNSTNDSHLPSSNRHKSFKTINLSSAQLGEVTGNLSSSNSATHCASSTCNTTVSSGNTTTTSVAGATEQTTATSATTTTTTISKKLPNTNKSSIESHTSVESWAHSNSSASLDSPSAGGSATHHRFYHVFREGELDALINHHVTSLHIVSSYYERASWCVVAEKVQVWTI